MGKKILSILCLSAFLAGCASTKEPAPVLDVPQPKKIEEEAQKQSIVIDELSRQPSSETLANIDEKALEEYNKSRGVIFAKTDFQGVLKTSYVKLVFQSTQDPKEQYELVVGDRANQTPLGWPSKTVDPGYFFIELPAGLYTISSVSIPVGSTFASEDIRVSLEVLPDVITYTGTLHVNGTKEKIKLGGVPVIKPGFEYAAQIINEYEEAISVFKEKYPNIQSNVQTKLMQIQP